MKKIIQEKRILIVDIELKTSNIIGAEATEVQVLPKNFVSTVIMLSKRAGFEAEKDHPEKVSEKWQEIWSTTDLGKSYISDYELYYPSREIEIHLGVK